MLGKSLLISTICIFCVYAQGPRPQPGMPPQGPNQPRPNGPGAPVAQMKPTVPKTCVPKCKEPDETCVRISECQGAKCHVCALTRSVRLPGTPVQLPAWPVRQMPQGPMGALGTPNVPSMASMAAMAGMAQPMGGRGMSAMGGRGMSAMGGRGMSAMGGRSMFQPRGFTDLMMMDGMGLVDFGLF